MLLSEYMMETLDDLLAVMEIDLVERVLWDGLEPLHWYGPSGWEEDFSVDGLTFLKGIWDL